MLYSEKLKSFQAAHPCETITVCGAQCRYILSGENIGRTLVFLNGDMNTLEMWMDYVLLAPVKGTDREELDYDELYAELPEDKKAEYEQKRQELLELSGLSD